MLGVIRLASAQANVEVYPNQHWFTMSERSESNGADTGIRTRDLDLTMIALCLLSYVGLFFQNELLFLRS